LAEVLGYATWRRVADPESLADPEPFVGQAASLGGRPVAAAS
jgi:hypothetical protein